MDERTKASLRKVIDYMIDAEKRHWVDEGQPGDHIYPEVMRLDDWLISETNRPLADASNSDACKAYKESPPIPFTGDVYELIMVSIEKQGLFPWIIRPWQAIAGRPGWYETEIGDMHTNEGFGIMVRARETESALQFEMIGHGAPHSCTWTLNSPKSCPTRDIPEDEHPF